MDEDRVPSYYAGGVSIEMTPWDLTIRFSVREGPTPKDIRPVANVTLSPQHALILAKLLARQVDLYQQQVGKIDLPIRLYNDLGLEP